MNLLLCISQDGDLIVSGHCVSFFVTLSHLIIVELIKFLEELDRRADEARKEMKKHVPERKERIVGTIQDSLPPNNAPKWTIDRNWLKGEVTYVLNVLIPTSSKSLVDGNFQ